jgi:hypothetical protein
MNPTIDVPWSMESGFSRCKQRKRHSIQLECDIEYIFISMSCKGRVQMSAFKVQWEEVLGLKELGNHESAYKNYPQETQTSQGEVTIRQ